MKDTEGAFKWIISIINSKKILYQITGGFAARLYGSQRELADIDIEIPDGDFEKIIPEVKEFIVYGPDQYVDENWNLKLMTLDNKGQLIDICGKAKIFDQNTQNWVDEEVDFAESVDFVVYDMNVKVVSKHDLLAYKSKLLWEVDRQDIEALSV
jgi:hypothetical protein